MQGEPIIKESDKNNGVCYPATSIKVIPLVEGIRLRPKMYGLTEDQVSNMSDQMIKDWYEDCENVCEHDLDIARVSDTFDPSG